ncbi:hypothetical protein EJ06DRAFT_255141 [Trichodelitschia bisporula]|uniref:Uncharacterized protein n=1 Tax=Trichodelitschia bisporula TaxID=703511 RepID=A0A6G1HJN9_9PEZI|nr:hypothetical protein EJ06DRAFT_255141 [Trichodelitschia bisporula]
MRDQQKRQCITSWTEGLSMNKLLNCQRGGDPESTCTRALWLNLGKAEHSHRIPTGRDTTIERCASLSEPSCPLLIVLPISSLYASRRHAIAPRVLMLLLFELSPITPRAI